MAISVPGSGDIVGNGHSLFAKNFLTHGVAELERIEVRSVPIAEVACAFKPHETTEQQMQWRNAAVAEFLP